MYHKIFHGVTSILIVVMGILLLSSVVHAGENETGFGWIWSGSQNSGGDVAGFGWVSANSINCDINDDGSSDGGTGCPAIGTPIANYGIDVPQSTDPDQKITGYAWSERIGWVSFNESDLVGCPSAPCNARRSGDEIHGWARIIAIPDSVNNNGDFEGWIKLHAESGDPVAYGVVLNDLVIPKEVSGYAWSDEFGWLDFSRMYVGPIPDLIICPSAINIPIDATLQLRLYIGGKKGYAACVDILGLTEITTDALAEWSSANPAIVTVDNAGQKGFINALGSGFGVITATYKGLTANSYITVLGSSLGSCGNGTLDAGEACDEGASNNGTCATGATCSPACTLNICSCTLP